MNVMIAILMITFIMMTLSKMYTGKFHPAFVLILGILSIAIIILAYVLDLGYKHYMG